MLTDYVQLEWGVTVAAAFRARLTDADAELPTLADLQKRRQRRDPPPYAVGNAHCTQQLCPVRSE